MSGREKLIPDSLLWSVSDGEKFSRMAASNDEKVRIRHSLFDPRPDLSDLSFTVSTSPDIPSVRNLPCYKDPIVW